VGDTMTANTVTDASATGAETRRRHWSLLDARLAPFVFLLPFMAVFVVFRLWPLITAVEMSFQNVKSLQGNAWVGLDNYQSILANPQFMTALSNTFVYTIMTLIILIPIPLALSALLDRGNTYKPLAWRIALFVPALASLVVVSFLFRVILGDNGLLNSFLSTLGLSPQAWLTSASLAIPSLLIIATWRWVGVNMLYFNSGLVNIGRELYEAAAIDGANGRQMFWHISVPLLRPTIIFVLIISVIGGFQLFVEPFLLWSGGNSPSGAGLSVGVLIYKTAFTSFKFGNAAAMGVVLAFIILLVSLVVFRLAGGSKALR
jgi:arabinosaccharide transport system permease protein